MRFGALESYQSYKELRDVLIRLVLQEVEEKDELKPLHFAMVGRANSQMLTGLTIQSPFQNQRIILNPFQPRHVAELYCQCAARSKEVKAFLFIFAIPSAHIWESGIINNYHLTTVGLLSGLVRK